MADQVSVNSPCMNICVINAETGYCLGCFRTIDEISGWQKIGLEDRARIVNELERRRNNSGGSGPNADP